MKDTRERLVDAAEGVLRKLGLSHLSTREVARAAGVADGAMYHHFADKNELLLAVLARPAPQYLEDIRNLPLLVGQHTVQDNLRALAWSIYRFHRHALPITCSLFADIELLERHRQILRANKVGPAATFEAIKIYLAAEQRIGRVSADADLEAVATLLVGGLRVAKRRCADVDGFSLHADVCVPARDRAQLERLCRYVARPAIASERLELLADGAGVSLQVRLGLRLRGCTVGVGDVLAGQGWAWSAAEQGGGRGERYRAVGQSRRTRTRTTASRCSATTMNGGSMSSARLSTAASVAMT